MICLSKADENAFRHLTWNQSPPSLASSHTTRQDLNGISNLRELVDAGQDDGAGIGSNGDTLNPFDEKSRLENPPLDLKRPLLDAGRQSCGTGT